MPPFIRVRGWSSVTLVIRSAPEEEPGQRRAHSQHGCFLQRDGVNSKLTCSVLPYVATYSANGNNRCMHLLSNLKLERCQLGWDRMRSSDPR